MKQIVLCLAISIHFLSSSAQTITTIAGNGIPSSSGDNGPANLATVNQPHGIVVDNGGNIYISESNVVRKINTSGIITTIAGNGTVGFSGDGGPATDAQLQAGMIAIDYFGNLYIGGGDRIRKVTPSGIITTIAGNGSTTYSGDGGPATLAGLEVIGIATDKTGNIYITDVTNSRIRKISTSGIINLHAGTGGVGYSSDGGPATLATLYVPMAIAADSVGNVYINVRSRVFPGGSIVYRNAIRKIDTSGIINTIAGSDSSSSLGDGGPATAANLTYLIYGIAVDTKGNLFFSDNERIREINQHGIIGTIAGNDDYGFSGDGGSSFAAQLDDPYGVATDLSGNIYIADSRNNRIRKITAPTAINNVNALPGSIALYPNPVQEDGVVYISGVGSSTIRLYNILGQPIASAYNTDNISLAACPAGIYLVRVFTPQGELLHQGKVVKE